MVKAVEIWLGKLTMMATESFFSQAGGPSGAMVACISAETSAATIVTR